MAATLAELIEQAAGAREARLVVKSKVRAGGVDPLGLRQINFGLMDLVFPHLNNVAQHVRPYVLMAWAWRRARWIVEAGRRGGADDEEMRDFVDRIEAIYAWSQFLHDARAGIPGGRAMAPLLAASRYRFGGAEWVRRRNMRRYSTGLISPLNYGPSLRTTGWLVPVDGGIGVFQPPADLDPALDAFEAFIADELSHPAFNRFGSVVVKREDAVRWGALWALDAPAKLERKAAFERLGGALADDDLRAGVKLARSAFRDLDDEAATIDEVRARMADLLEQWESEEVPVASARWRETQVRQVFRLALEVLLHWTIGALEDGPLTSARLAQAFLDELDDETLPATGGEWLLAPAERDNPVDHLVALRTALKSGDDLEDAIIAALRHALAEAPARARSFENADRLPLARARAEMEQWAAQPPAACLVRMIESWIMAQHAYWCVGRGLADARNRGKKILRLRIVMDEGGWTLTPGTSQGNPPQETPDRLESALRLMDECRKLP